MEINKQKKRSEWRRKGWTIPDLRGKKTEWFILVKNLITLINDNNISDLSLIDNFERKFRKIYYLWSNNNYIDKRK